MAALPPEGALLLMEAMPIKAGGCAANVAIDLAKQHITTEVAGCVGNDSAGQVLCAELVRHDVGVSQVVTIPAVGTSKTVILLIDGQDRRYLHLAGANQAFRVEHISRDWLADLKVFYLGGLFALPGLDLVQLAALLEFCRANKVTTVVDVVVPHEVRGLDSLRPLLPLIDMFVPNEDEARAFTGLTEPIDQLHAFENAGAHTVIITRGSHGSVAAHAGHIWSCGTYEMSVVDPSGSGDAFTSGVIRSLLMGWDVPQTMRYASALGASATRSAGTTDAVFSAEEAEKFVSDFPITVINGY
jgi:sugar/nucleoside kinase (ribokinase family)